MQTESYLKTLVPGSEEQRVARECLQALRELGFFDYVQDELSKSLLSQAIMAANNRTGESPHFLRATYEYAFWSQFASNAKVALDSYKQS